MAIKETALQQEDAVIKNPPVDNHLPCCNVSLNNNLSTLGSFVLFDTEGALPQPPIRIWEFGIWIPSHAAGKTKFSFRQQRGK